MASELLGVVSFVFGGTIGVAIGREVVFGVVSFFFGGTIGKSALRFGGVAVLSICLLAEQRQVQVQLGLESLEA